MARNRSDIDEVRARRVITIDQAIAGSSNLLIALLAARVLPASGFGLFGIVFVVYTIFQGVSRALVCDPLLVHPEEAQSRAGEAIGASIVLGLAMGAVGFAASLIICIWSRELGFALMVLTIAISPLILQDLGRYFGFATKRPSRAVALDTVWLVAMIIGVVVLLVAHVRSLTWFMIVWAGAGGGTALLTLWQHRGQPIQLGIRWIRFTWPFSWRYLISYSSSQGAGLVASSTLGAVAGTKALGGVQGTVALIRPFATFQLASVAAGVAEIARNRFTPSEAFSRGIRISTLTTIVAFVNAVILLFLPTNFGEAVLGDSWRYAKPLLLPNGVQIVCLGLITGARAGLLGLRAVQRTVKIDVVNTILVMVTSITGVLIHGVLGALWAVAICQAFMATLWWTVFRWHLNHPSESASLGEVEQAEQLPTPAYPPNEAPVPVRLSAEPVTGQVATSDQDVAPPSLQAPPAT